MLISWRVFNSRFNVLLFNFSIFVSGHSIVSEQKCLKWKSCETGFRAQGSGGTGVPNHPSSKTCNHLSKNK